MKQALNILKEFANLALSGCIKRAGSKFLTQSLQETDLLPALAFVVGAACAVGLAAIDAI